MSGLVPYIKKGMMFLGIAYLFALSITTAGAVPDSATGPGPVQNLVAVMTDFGTTDFYVGALEGSIYSANPLARISTITHEVKAYDIAEGSYILSKAAEIYPSGTVFVVEVNPGSSKDVGFIVLETLDGKMFVGPDNGVFTGVVSDMGLAHAYQITNQSLMGDNTTTTFRGAYIYGPVGGHLSGGMSPGLVGPEVDSIKLLPVASASAEGSEVSGAIIHVDKYGNLITNIAPAAIDQVGMVVGESLNLTVGNHSILARFVRTYGDVPEGDWLVLVSSTGEIEIARNMENAAGTIGASAGDAVRLASK